MISLVSNFISCIKLLLLLNCVDFDEFLFEIKDQTISLIKVKFN
jgi:hypothetical protein